MFYSVAHLNRINACRNSRVAENETPVRSLNLLTSKSLLFRPDCHYGRMMPRTDKRLALAVERLASLIHEIRGEKVMLDSDLAQVYGVQTKALNRAVKRNRDRFPKDFMFQISATEWQDLKYQFGTSSLSHGGRRRRPYAFTEHGAIMAANVLNSTQAAQMSVFVVRAFIAMRRVLNDTNQLARKLSALEKELKERLDVHEAAIVTILQRVMDIIDPPPEPEPLPKQIGFHVRERSGRYRTRPRRINRSRVINRDPSIPD